MSSESLINLENWAEHINQQLVNITTTLKEMESLVDKLDYDDVILMDLLNDIESIQIISKNLANKVDGESIKKDLEIQIELLQSTLRLLKIENGTSS